MADVKIQRLTIRLRGVPVAAARRAIVELGPALRAQLAPGSIAGGDRDAIRLHVPRGTGPLAQRIATPLARVLRGEGDKQ